VYDAIVHPDVIEDANGDPTGRYRHFLCTLVIQYLEQKVGVCVCACVCIRVCVYVCVRVCARAGCVIALSADAVDRLPMCTALGGRAAWCKGC
jgi:hypothetical protein